VSRPEGLVPAPGKSGKPLALGAYIFAGGFSIGVRKHFELTAHFEDGDYGAATARKYLKLPVHTDADRWPWEDYVGRVGFLYGNPPCAAWSPLGPRAQRGLDAWKLDARVDCTRAHFNLLELVRPTVWAWESVPQAFSTGRGLVDHLAERAGRLGYAVDFVLHNAQYLGAHQSRKRFFFVASRVDIDWHCPWKTALPAGEAIKRAPMSGANGEGWPAGFYYKPEFLRMVPPGGALRATYPTYLERLQKRRPKMTETERKKLAPRPSFGERRLPLDRPSGAVVDSKIIHPTELRYLTLGEMGFLGGYPPAFINALVGNSTEHKARLLTRAVLPPVGAWLAGNVRRAIDAATPAPAGRVREVNLYKPPGEVVKL
jgi:site-specific DNA-cytosine methylase